MKKSKTIFWVLLPLIVYLLSGILLYTYARAIGSSETSPIWVANLVYLGIITIIFSIIYGILGYKKLRSIWLPAVINFSSIILFFMLSSIFSINLNQYDGMNILKIIQNLFIEFIGYISHLIFSLSAVFIITIIVSALTKLLQQRKIRKTMIK